MEHTNSFSEKLLEIQSKHTSVVSVGLDPDPEKLPGHLRDKYTAAEAVERFCREIIDTTSEYVCAFKLNLAFFESLGNDGWRILERTVTAIPPDIITIADAKRGDIGNSAKFYAASLFEHLRVDACTVSPYMGYDSVKPFLMYEGTAAFILARTSNPGSLDFQEKECGGAKLYLQVARRASEWASDMPAEAGLVVGATDASALASIRKACPTEPFLIPGIGAQGGDIKPVMTVARTNTGSVIVNSSRKILYASSGFDYASAAAREAESLRRQLNHVIFE